MSQLPAEPPRRGGPKNSRGSAELNASTSPRHASALVAGPALLLLTALVWAQAPSRVRVRLDGFDLSHAGTASNQIGTGSHEVPTGGAEDAAPAMAAPPPSRPGMPGLMQKRANSGAAGTSGAPAGSPGTSPNNKPALKAPPLAKAYSTTPTFYWIADQPDGSYAFSIGPDQGGLPLYTTTVKGDHFTYPATAPALLPGNTYAWSVRPAAPLLLSRTRATAHILIIGGQERAALDDRLTALRANAAGAAPAEAEAQAMTDARIWYDALTDYTMLIDQHPTPAYYRQRSALYDQLPQTYALADADLAKAIP